MAIPEDFALALSAAHQEALRVGDSPLRADLLADKLAPLAGRLDGMDALDETKGRVRSALEAAERALRRDDDGREAARHLQAAIRLTETRPSRPSPFLDDD